MHLSENEGIEGNTFVVTGGLGFVGSALCLELVRRGAEEVRSLDSRQSSPWLIDLKKKGVICIKGDVSRKSDVEKALRGVDCVFHLASYGMSGKEMLQVGRIDEVNINGTCHILDACHAFGIRRLVYVSTYNVIFGGAEIINGNEALPYFPVDDHVDSYGRSKSIGEQLVLKSNGRPSKSVVMDYLPIFGTQAFILPLRYSSKKWKKNGAQLFTCAIRPASIYGPGEDRHFPRILSLAKMGLLTFKIGGPNVKTDWVYVDNLVLALILASMGLLDNIPGKEGNPVAAGQPYFISDGEPVNTFDFICTLLQSLGYDSPKHSLSVPHTFFLARIFLVVYTMLYPWLNSSWLPQPMILPAEVYKVGVTHYFSYLKAKEELGYFPMVNPRQGMATTISYWQEKKRRMLDGPTIYPWLFAIFGMSILFCAAFIPHLGPFEGVRYLYLFLFRSLRTVQIAFCLSVAAHVAEGFYAWHLAKRVDPLNSRGWFWQTIALGFFSLRYLLKRAKS